MTIDEAIDRNVELRGELIKLRRLEKAQAVQLSNEALKGIASLRKGHGKALSELLPGETKD